MNDAASQSDTHDIVVEEVFPHAPETIWKTLTTGELIARWLMAPTGFEPVVGNHFTFRTTAAGAWDGTIRCEVLEVTPNERIRYAWRGGHDANVGYGSRLDTVVTWSLTRVEQGTRLRLVHSGFVLPKNESALTTMGEGWKKVVQNIRAIARGASGAYTGGCACGAVRYEIADEPLASNDCQCRDCQRRSGTGHGSYLTFPSQERVELVGEAHHWDVVADNGNVKTHAFCPTCGAPVYLRFSNAPELFTVHAASLDDPGRFRPQMVTYAVRGHAWDHLDPGLPRFEKMPPR